MAQTPALNIDETEIDALSRALLAWYDHEQRPLPWRSQPSEYKTVLSEFMLQQTQVNTVLPYFERFLERFPSFQALADASEQDVLHEWSGLGYYARARNLKRAAEAITYEYDGRLPRDPDLLAGLPGFGEYTVGAVGSIALGMRLPLVDGNVRRVVARLFALEGDLTKGEGKRRLWEICGRMVPEARPGDFNQALMELGATVCTPRDPLCLVCPLLEPCRARQAGNPEAYPEPVKRAPLKQVNEVAVALVRRDQVLVVQRGDEGAFAGMWEFPRMDSRELKPRQLEPAKVLFETVRIRPGRCEMLGQAESTFTNHKITTELYRAQALGSQRVRRQRHANHQWIRIDDLHDLPASKAQRRLFKLLQRQR